MTDTHKHKAIVDSGATGHFLPPDFHLNKCHPTANPIHVKLPDGNLIQSMHTGQLPLKKYHQQPPQHTLFQALQHHYYQSPFYVTTNAMFFFWRIKWIFFSKMQSNIPQIMSSIRGQEKLTVYGHYQ